MRNKTHRKKNKNNRTKKLQCSPGNKNNFSCYSNDTLIKMKNNWNRNNNTKIKSKTPINIWNAFNKIFTNKTSLESQWIELMNINENEKNKIKADSFAPEQPKEWKNNPNTWLTNYDIDKVLKQYSKAYKCFSYIGPSPIDYDSKDTYESFKQKCVCNSLCNFNINKYLKQNKNCVAVVFNLDKHTEGGSHWVTLLLHLKNRQIYYFDSVGTKIPPQIEKMKDTIIEQCKNKNIHLKFFQLWPKTFHQESNTECGMYVLYFIIKMIEGKKWNYFINKKITDKEIMNYRNKYFNIKLG